MSFFDDATLTLKFGKITVELPDKFLICSDILTKIGILLGILDIIKCPIGLG